MVSNCILMQTIGISVMFLLGFYCVYKKTEIKQKLALFWTTC